MTIYYSKERTAANLSAPRIGIKVKNDVIQDAWYFIPGGQWRGSEPTELIGTTADKTFLKDFVKSSGRDEWL